MWRENDAEQSLAAKAAAHRSWANTADRTKRTEPARRAFEARFEHEVDPLGQLDAKERAIRAESARRAYFADLARRSAQARRRSNHSAVNNSGNPT